MTNNDQTQQQINALVSYIRSSEIHQLERIQLIVDSVILAAEQVQDKRIDLLEQPPEVTGSQLLIDFGITFLLESPIAGIILQNIVRKMALPLARRYIAAREYAIRASSLSAR